ncbi:IclR family transcriptional regulator [Brevundimonas sp.]|jgi:DNA-binding IclR family transcriptional regulator|uniref:IclR family transcriptional regulator n=1 Tax=Brevundimonas sp. TaxID=1871086 RepID=UPI0037849277
MTSSDPSVPTYRAPALEKGLDILELLAERGEPMTVGQISVALGRSTSELFRMLQVLQHRGYVGPAPSGDGLVLTNRLFALGMTRPPAKSLHEAALPAMRRLSQTVSQSCHLAVASGERMVVVTRIEAPGNQGFSVRVGYSRPIIASTSGLVLFAFQPDWVRRDWETRLRRGVSDAAWADFQSRAAQARDAGHVRANSAVVPHIFDLSAPIYDADGVAAALTSPYVGSPTAIPVMATIAAIQATAAEISAELGGGVR